MEDRKLADIDFKLEWKSTCATHTDTYFIAKINPYSDKLPDEFAEKILALEVGESCSQTFPAKDVLDQGYSNDKVITFESALFDQNFKGQYSPPILYRFYPSAIAPQGLETDASDYTPFRIISTNADKIVADKNHPLAKYYLTLTASKLKEYDFPSDDKGRKKNIGKLISSRGPGMQAPFEYGDSVFFDQYPFQQADNHKFLTPQFDSISSKKIVQLYSQLLPKHSKVLDLMSSEFSYLSDTYETGLLNGIGFDEDALSANERLDTYQVQDLNIDTTLPFKTNSFDDAICTLSIESLNDPLKIMREVARVVNSGGKFIITFSDYSVSPNAITLWGQLHPFERMQLILEYFRKTDLFEDLNTLSSRGINTTKDSSINKNKRISSHVFGVWGKVI